MVSVTDEYCPWKTGANARTQYWAIYKELKVQVSMWTPNLQSYASNNIQVKH